MMNTIHDINVGDSDSYTKTIVDADVVLYACMTGDFNPVHISDAFAEKSPHGRRIVHDGLVSGLISTVLGTRLPGPGSRCLRHTMEYLAPVYVGDTLTASVQVIQRDMDRDQVSLSTWCVTQDGAVVVQGVVLMGFLKMAAYTGRILDTVNGDEGHARIQR